MIAYKIRWEMNKEDIFVANPIADASFNSVVDILGVIAAIVVFLELEDVNFYRRALISLAFIPLFYGVLYGVVYLLAKVTLYKRKAPLPVVNLLIDEVGIHGERSTDSSFLLKWERIQDIKEKKKYLIVRTKKKERLAIPKRYFDTQGDLAEVLSFMKEQASGNNNSRG